MLYIFVLHLCIVFRHLPSQCNICLLLYVASKVLRFSVSLINCQREHGRWRLGWQFGNQVLLLELLSYLRFRFRFRPKLMVNIRFHFDFGHKWNSIFGAGFVFGRNRKIHFRLDSTNMNYDVFGGMLNLAQQQFIKSFHSPAYVFLETNHSVHMEEKADDLIFLKIVIIHPESHIQCSL